MTAICRRITESSIFHGAVMTVIVFTAVLMGLETSRTLMARYGPAFELLNTIVQVIFVLEIAVRMAACLPRLHMFFASGWNLFDFTVVAFSLLPQTGAFAMVARLARLLRVTRLVSVSSELRLIVTTMLKSIPSLGHVILLIAMLLYVYGVLGFHVFGEDDPANWGTLVRAMMTLFQILTLEGWVEIMEAGNEGHPFVWFFYGSYIVIAVFVVINLFIAVVLNNLEKAKSEQALEEDSHPARPLLERLSRIREEIDEIEKELAASSK